MKTRATRAASGKSTVRPRAKARRSEPSGQTPTARSKPGKASAAAPSASPAGDEPGAAGEPAARARFGLPIELPGEDGGMMDAARELLSTDYYLRQWGRIGMRNRSEVVDDFGMDPKYSKRLQPLMDVLYSKYFRVQTSGMENVPQQGRALVVANHSGALPYDALMLRTAIGREQGQGRALRWLVENHVFYMPFVGSVLNRMGAVRACQQNAERLLRADHLVAVFPEGQKGQGRLYRDRYKLERFGRGGFIRLCLRTGTPIVPCAIVGPEDAMPLLYKFESVARIGGVPFLPVTPTFPLLGPVGLLPAPTRWQIAFGPGIHLEGYEPEAAADDVLVRRLAERVRATIQTMLDGLLAARRSVWLG